MPNVENYILLNKSITKNTRLAYMIISSLKRNSHRCLSVNILCWRTMWCQSILNQTRTRPFNQKESHWCNETIAKCRRWWPSLTLNWGRRFPQRRFSATGPSSKNSTPTCHLQSQIGTTEQLPSGLKQVRSLLYNVPQGSWKGGWTPIFGTMKKSAVSVVVWIKCFRNTAL